MSGLSSLFGGGATIKKFRLFTASGTWTFPASIVKDSAGNATVLLTAIGGGEAGSVSSGTPHGGASGQSVQRYPVTVSANQAVVVGAGGTGSSTAARDAGSPTSFGAVSVAGGSYSARTNTAMETQASAGPFGMAAPAHVSVATCGGAGLALGTAYPRGDDRWGYGGGSAGRTTGTSADGNPGAVLVEWEEYI